MSYANDDSMLVKGFFPKPKHANAPDFVIAKGSINLPMFAEFMREFKEKFPGQEWVNIDMKMSKAGKGVAVTDPWEPDASKAPAPQAQAAPPPSVDESLPF